MITFVTIPTGNYVCSGSPLSGCVPTRAILVDGIFSGAMTCDNEAHCQRAVDEARRAKDDPVLSAHPITEEQLRSLSG